MRLAESCSRPN